MFTEEHLSSVRVAALGNRPGACKVMQVSKGQRQAEAIGTDFLAPKAPAQVYDGIPAGQVRSGGDLSSKVECILGVSTECGGNKPSMSMHMSDSIKHLEVAWLNMIVSTCITVSLASLSFTRLSIIVVGHVGPHRDPKPQA